MRLGSEVVNIVDKVFVDKIYYLLGMPYHSIEAGFIMASADSINRTSCNSKAEVHAQIDLNLSPCLYDCKFYAFAAQNKVLGSGFLFFYIYNKCSLITTIHTSIHVSASTTKP